MIGIRAATKIFIANPFGLPNVHADVLNCRKLALWAPSCRFLAETCRRILLSPRN